MRGIVLSALAASVLALGAPPAAAADEYVGGCGFEADDLHIGSEDHTGVLYAVVAAYDDTTPTALPIVGRCWIEVDSVAQPGTALEFSGTGVAAGGTTIEYSASDEQSVELCQSITYGSTSESACFPAAGADLIEVIEDLIDVLCSVSDCGVILTSFVCAVLGGLAPGVPGVVDIDSDGDLAIAGEPVWDCPPYGSQGEHRATEAR